MRRRGIPALALAAALGPLWLAAPAGAGNGRLEISHVGILQAGGYPLSITAPGSYVLTSDLTPPAGAGGIAIGATVGPVTIDLNGFSISGSGGAAGDGISGGTRVLVHGGVVHGMGGNGINLGPDSLVRDCRIFDNGGAELVLGAGSNQSENLISDPATGATVVGAPLLGGGRCDGVPCPKTIKTWVFPHVLEQTGSVNTTSNTFDTSIFVTYVAGLPGTQTPANLPVDVDLYLFDETTGGLMESSGGSTLCGPCPFPMGDGSTLPRKRKISLEDLISSGGGFPDNDGNGLPDDVASGFAIVVVQGDAESVSLMLQQERSLTNPGALSVFGFEPQEITAVSE